MGSIDRENDTNDNSMENSIHIEESFVLIHDTMYLDEKHLETLNNRIEELEKRNKKIEDDYEKLERRHGDLLKLMNELLKIKPSNHVDCLENLDEIRQRITQILYNEVRRHTVFSFTPILGSYTIKYQQTAGTVEPALDATPRGVALHGNYPIMVKSASIHHISNSNIINTGCDDDINLNVD
jgi:hypothetical protein